MPRDRGLKNSIPGGSNTNRSSRANSTRTRANRGSVSNRKKITIRPYQKPPSLPKNYYEDTVKNLLKGTLDILKSDGRSNVTKNENKSSASVSLQNSYTTVIHLVSHQFGPSLYKDLHKSLHEAAKLSLSDSFSVSEDDTSLLRRLPQVYKRYTQYLLCVQHVFLPLDRTHLWLSEMEEVMVLRGATPGIETNTTPSTGTSNAPAGKPVYFAPQPAQQDQQNIWQLGLCVFGKRLQELNWDSRLYEEWLRTLLYDWNTSGYLPTKVANIDSVIEENPLRRRQDLQAIWYFWQDLGWLPRLSLPQDLEEYWRGVSQSWTENPSSGVAGKLIEFMHEKHQHVQQWPWLPTSWLHGILESCLVAQHLRESLDEKVIDTTKNRTNAAFLPHKTVQPAAAKAEDGPSPIMLLSPANFDPILKAATSVEKENASTSIVVQLWALAGRLPGGQTRVARAIAKFAKRESMGYVAAEPSGSGRQDPSNNFIADLLKLQAAFRRLLAILPHSKEVVPLKPVWEEVVNVAPPSGQPSVAENLAKFLDSILRSNKRMDQYQRECDQWLNRIISGIFVPLQAKDIFEAFYKKDLAKRLLWNRVVSMDVEKQVCSLLKAECGNAYTSKIEGMFQDVEFSRETMMVYKQSPAGGSGGTRNYGEGVEMEVQVLTTGYWPVYPQYPNLNLPEQLKRPQESFANHYKSKYQGRRMAWQYALGHCVVRCSGFTKVYDLVVNLCQALVLCQFTSSSQLGIKELMDVIGLEDRDEMERIMQSLSLGKEGTRILRKIDYDAQPQKRRKVRMNVDDKDRFEINESFESNQRRIRIQNIMVKETKEERDKTVEAVSRDRLYLIDAVLVRIMKARKTILHQALIPQVLEQVKVPAQPADVKKRIESLIEREYMERDAKDRSRYNYLA